MTLDQTMCQQAAAYAAKIANMGTLMHSSKEQRSGQGENLTCQWAVAQMLGRLLKRLLRTGMKYKLNPSFYF